jgi:hypothetical protein
MPQDWNERLKTNYKSRARPQPHRPVRLPAESSMRVSGEENHAIIEMRTDAVYRNMQENGAAFEGWCLALRYWCKADKITLKWQPKDSPASGALTTEQRHYQRFLYRVERFQSLFDWFDVAVIDPFRHSRVINSGPLFLNVAGKLTKKAESNKSLPAFDQSEHALETRLLNDPQFNGDFKFGEGAFIDRQFPVGLFSTSKPANSSAIFPGGKGAIDLVCLDNQTLWLFELKANKNIPIGTLTEILFYTSVMRDVRIGKFQFGTASYGVDGSPNPGHRGKFNPHSITQIDSIEGVMLGHDIHPLLADPGLICLLNDAVKTHWNCDADAPAVSFRVGRIGKNLGFENIGTSR